VPWPSGERFDPEEARRGRQAIGIALTHLRKLDDMLGDDRVGTIAPEEPREPPLRRSAITPSPSSARPMDVQVSYSSPPTAKRLLPRIIGARFRILTALGIA
jgi:hypothetical protein